MTDIVSKEVRSKMMSGIRGKNTKPELIIRHGLFALGLRYRLHVRDLPGKPDLVFPKYKTALFINGCFWHGHDCKLFKAPSTNQDFWEMKINKTRINDEKNKSLLLNAGWKVVIVWECAIKNKKNEFPALLQGVYEIIKNSCGGSFFEITDSPPFNSHFLRDNYNG